MTTMMKTRLKMADATPLITSQILFPVTRPEEGFAYLSFTQRKPAWERPVSGEAFMRAEAR